MKSFKLWLPDVLVVLFFAILAFAYFYPADVEDRVLNQGDISAGIGSGQEQSEYLKKTGERTRWTNSLFSGMPTYQLAPSYSSTDTLSAVESAYHLWLPDNVWYVLSTCWASISCCVPSTSVGIWPPWEVCSGLSAPISSSS